MNNIVLFDTGRLWLLKQLMVGAFTTLDGFVTCRLFSNALTLTPAGPSVPYTNLVMPGYSPFLLSGALDEGIDANGNDTWIWPVTTITCMTGSGGPYAAYGYRVTANLDGTVLWGQLFDTPASWLNFGDYATLAPQFSLGALDLPPSPILLPVVLSVTPNTGPAAGGTSVTITGAYFTGATAVTFGGGLASSFTVVTDNIIQAVSPMGAAGVVDVEVITPAGVSNAWVHDQFTYT